MTRTQFLTLLCSPFVLPLLPKEEPAYYSGGIHPTLESIREAETHLKNYYEAEAYIWDDVKYEWRKFDECPVRDLTNPNVKVFFIHGEPGKRPPW